MRLHTAPDHGLVGTVATTIAQDGAVVTAIDVTESRLDRLVVDVTCSAADQSHSEELVHAVEQLEGVVVHKVSDRTFLLHIGGKISVESMVPLRTCDDLALVSRGAGMLPRVGSICARQQLNGFRASGAREAENPMRRSHRGRSTSKHRSVTRRPGPHPGRPRA
jgi:hypothetical protein